MGLGTRGRWDVGRRDVGMRGRGTWDAGPPGRGTRGLGDVGTWGLENVATRDVERRYSRT